MKKQIIRGIVLTLLVTVMLSACGAEQPEPAAENESPETETASQTAPEMPAETERENTEMTLKMTIGGTEVKVKWEENESVEALKELCRETPLTISMSMYGGFEQVGPIGARLPSDDVQTSTAAGDIVLYSGNQIVVFYGTNSWAYTRLGHIEDRDAEGMKALLGNGDVTITISTEE